MEVEQQKWEWEINSKSSWAGASLKELYSYKDLLFRLVRKEFLASFQQTVLGPFWVIFQPLLTVITYVVVFGKVIGISTDGFPAFLYYLIGITLWNLFSDIFTNISYTFSENAEVFSKVYFPRLIAPLSSLVLHLFQFGIQLLFLFCTYFYFCFVQVVDFNIRILLIIPVIIITSGIGFGSGLILSLLSTKYKDLIGLMALFVRLLMFACPIFYSVAIVPEKLKTLVYINPLSSQFEWFRYAFLGKGQVELLPIMYSIVFMIVLLISGILFFNKLGDKLMDVV